MEILVRDKPCIIKLCRNKLDCLNEINFCVNLFSRMPILNFFCGLIFADERIPKTSCL